MEFDLLVLNDCVQLQAVQMLFEQSQASFDPNNIMALLQEHPYHVDSLLTMHELYRYA